MRKGQNLGAAQPWHLLHTDPSLTPQTSCSPLALIGLLSQKQPTHPFPSPLQPSSVSYGAISASPSPHVPMSGSLKYLRFVIVDV
uniref:Uncharacterized protein n=1 Tax=Nomascus leucogenys TaxID=61853 RepID=A0A2I3GVE4_NOMLE